MCQNPNSKIIICDVNVVVLAYLFKSSILDHHFTFGSIEIHQTVLDELESWKTSTAKIKKFTLPTIQTLIIKCETLLSSLPALTVNEQQQQFRRISRVEGSIPNHKKGMETSSFDKTYLALANKYGGVLATQEATLRQLAPLILDENRLSSFEDMLIDAYDTGVVTKQDVIDGISNLNYYQETLRKGELSRIKAHVGIP